MDVIYVARRALGSKTTNIQWFPDAQVKIVQLSIGHPVHHLHDSIRVRQSIQIY